MKAQIIRPPDIVCRRTYILPAIFLSFLLSSLFFRRLIFEPLFKCKWHCRPIFDQLRLRKIVKFVAARCQILKLKCTKVDFGWGFVPDPTGVWNEDPPGRRSPNPLDGFKSPISRKKRGWKGKWRRWAIFSPQYLCPVGAFDSSVICLCGELTHIL